MKVGKAIGAPLRVLGLVVAIAIFGASSTSASQVNKPVSHPPANPEMTNMGKQPLDIPEAALKRQIKQLEHAEHLLDLAAGNDRRSHSAVAARHIQVAISELKMQLQEKEKGGEKEPNGHASSSGAGSPKKKLNPPASLK